MFSKKVQLGLDLQGGLYTVYGVDLDKAVEDKAIEIKREFEAALQEKKIEAEVLTPRTPVGAIHVIPKNPADAAKIDASFLEDYSDVLVSLDCPEDRENAVCFTVSSEFADRVKESAVEQNIEIIKDRVDRFGVAEPSIMKKGDGIVVELPGLNEQEIDRLKSIIDRSARLEFKMVDENHPFMQKLAQKVMSDPVAKEKGIEVDFDRWTDDSGQSFSDTNLVAKDRKVFLSKEDAQKYGCYRRDKEAPGGKYECVITGRTVLEEYLATLPPEYQPDQDHEIGYEEVAPVDVAEAQTPEKTWRTYYLHRTAELTGSAISSADVVFNPTTSRPEVLVVFNRYGTRRFGDLTTNNVGKKMAIILDEQVNSAPVIQGPITGGRSTITMGGSDPRIVQQEAQDLVNVLRTGSLSAPLKELTSTRVGPMLGADAIERAEISMLVGAAAVILIMLFFYRVSGLIAVLAMTMNLLFQLAILAGLQATLTLPGIAALVLTIGMAVDANIIIYERIREELRAGKSVRGAVDAGFGRAFWAIFDSQLTTFIAGFVLLEYGTGPIRGFAVMLLIGVITNLFTATWASRLMFEHYVGRRRAATASLSI